MRTCLTNPVPRGIGITVALLAVSGVTHCAEDIELGRNHGAVGVLDAAPQEGGTTSPPQAVACGTTYFQCGDGLDNDADGKIDSDDEDCLGPCDATEDSLGSGFRSVPSMACRRDCYFDDNSGRDDRCTWDYRCDPLSVAPDYPPSGRDNCAYDPAGQECLQLAEPQSETCLANCLPSVPNGCDCFGCCEVPGGSGNFVFIGSESEDIGLCAVASSQDPNICRPCTPVPSCFNACSPCEICLGKSTLPPECEAPQDGSVERCPNGQTPCGPGSVTSCSQRQYCITGCCVDVIR